MTPFSLDNLLEDWRKLLMLWSQTGALSRAAQKALQLSAEPAALRQLVGRWRTGDVQDLPPVQVLPASAMPNAAGAYARSTGTIYLNQDWLRGASRESVLAVLSEELGHHLDGLLNASDTPGDEGELFADVLQGVTVSKGELRRINAEDDQAVATIDGQKLEIEQAGIPFSYLYNPVGIAIDAQGNILANNDSGSSLLFSRFSSSGTLLKQVQYRGGIFDFGHLSAISNQKDIFQLQSDGDLIIINSSDLSFTGQINLKLLPVDTSSIFDISTSSLGDMGGLINPSAANTQYGDIALLERGNQQDIFVSGKSMGTFPFVMRLRYKSGIFQSCKVIVASRGTTAGGVNLTRGVAVNKQGVVLTTLPIAVGKNSPTFMDVPVSFNADYPESGAGSPQIPLRGQGASYSDGSNYVDFASQGMTTDAAGNFYVVTNSLGSVSLRAAGGTLIVLPPTLSTVRAVLTEGYSQSFTSYRDVAVDSNSNQAFVTSSTGNVIAFALPDLKPAKADFNADGRADLIMANARGGWSGIWTMNGTSPSGWTTLPYASGALPVGAGDFNNDGRDDLIMVNASGGWSGIWTMNGTSPSGWTTLPYASGALPVGAGDFNNDGRDDLIMVNASGGWSGIWTMNGTSPSGWTTLPYASGALPVGAGDFNNDGRDDLIMVNASGGWSGIWTMNGTSPSGWTTLPYASGALPVGAGDFNNDGRDDLIMVNASGGWSGIWTMNGTSPSGWTTLPYASGALPV